MAFKLFNFKKTTTTETVTEPVLEKVEKEVEIPMHKIELLSSDTSEMKISKVEEYLQTNMLVSGGACYTNAVKICEFEDVYENFKELVNNGEYSKDSPKICGLNAYIMTNPPIGCSKLLAICMLADIKKHGIESGAFKSCYMSLIMSEDAKEILSEVSKYVNRQ